VDPQLLSSPWVRVPPVLLTLVVLQLTLVAGMPLFRTTADLLLLAAVAAALVAGPERGAVLGLVFGFAYDLVLQTPFGLSALTSCLVAYAVGRVRVGMLQPVWWVAPAATVVASAAGIGLYAALATVLGEVDLLERRLLVTMAVVGVLNGVWGLVVRPVVRWSLAGDAAATTAVVR